MIITPGKKQLPILILEIMRNYTDDQHCLRQQDIIDKIYDLYEIKCERKAVSKNLQLLIDLDFDIQKNSKGYFLGSRHLEPSEVRFLVDAVFSSKSIDCTHSKLLADKLSSFLSTYQRSKYKYIYKSGEINRTNNKNLFYNIEILNEAIEKGHQVEFEYERFSFKNNGKTIKTCLVNPYFLINNQGKYYLVCNYDYYNDVANYKLEKIRNIKILPTKAKPITKLRGYENGIDIAKYANENIYMFSSLSIKGVVKLADDIVTSAVDDWFGKNATYFEKNGNLYAEIKANEESLIYWCLQYGKSVELISPINTRNKIKQIVDNMQNRYAKDVSLN